MQEDVTDNIKKVVNENIWGSIKEFLNFGFHFGILLFCANADKGI